MIGDVLNTCLECIAVTIKCLDGKIWNLVKISFLNLIYIKLARVREMKIVLMNWAGKLWSVCVFTS